MVYTYDILYTDERTHRGNAHTAKRWRGRRTGSRGARDSEAPPRTEARRQGVRIERGGQNLRNDNRVITYSEGVRQEPYKVERPKADRRGKKPSNAGRTETTEEAEPTNPPPTRQGNGRGTRTGRGTIAKRGETPRATATPPTLTPKILLLFLQKGLTNGDGVSREGSTPSEPFRTM